MRQAIFLCVSLFKSGEPQFEFRVNWKQLLATIRDVLNSPGARVGLQICVSIGGTVKRGFDE